MTKSFVVTFDDAEAGPREAWDLFVLMFPERAADTVYVPPADIHTGTAVMRHLQLGLTITEIPS